MVGVIQKQIYYETVISSLVADETINFDKVSGCRLKPLTNFIRQHQLNVFFINYKFPLKIISVHQLLDFNLFFMFEEIGANLQMLWYFDLIFRKHRTSASLNSLKNCLILEQQLTMKVAGAGWAGQSLLMMLVELVMVAQTDNGWV